MSGTVLVEDKFGSIESDVVLEEVELDMSLPWRFSVDVSSHSSEDSFESSGIVTTSI